MPPDLLAFTINFILLSIRYIRSLIEDRLQKRYVVTMYFFDSFIFILIISYRLAYAEQVGNFPFKIIINCIFISAKLLNIYCLLSEHFILLIEKLALSCSRI